MVQKTSLCDGLTQWLPYNLSFSWTLQGVLGSATCKHEEISHVMAGQKLGKGWMRKMDSLQQDNVETRALG
jgi:hypothetical protein